MNARRASFVVILLSCLLLPALPAAADLFTLVTNGSANWSNTSTWLQNGGPASRTPGSSPPTIDVVNLTVATYTITVDLVLNEAVQINTTCPSSTSTCVLSVPSGGTLKLSGASTIGSDARVQLSGGLIDNAGTLSFALASRLDMSSGTLKGFGSTDIAFDSTFPAQWNISGGVLNGHTVNLHGKALQTGSWSIDSSGHVNITTNGIFDIQAAGPILTNAPGLAKITNGGTFEKTTVVGSTNVAVPVHNNGIVKAWAGNLVLGGNPTHTNGTFNVATGCTVEIHGTFAGNCAIAGAGDAVIVGTPVIDNGATLAIENLRMSGGWLQGPVSGSATATVTGTITFDGGVWQRNLTVTMQNGSLLDFTGTGTAFIDNAHVINDSGATIELTPGGGLGINNGGHVTNNGTFKLLGDASINSDSVNNARIDNASTFEKTSGAGFSNVNVFFNNSGTTSVLSGILNFSKDGTHTGSFSVASGSALDFSGGTHTVAGSNFNGTTGITKVNGATFSTSIGGAVIGTQFLQTGGIVTGSTQLTINNSFNWSGGSQTGTGETVLTGAFNHIFNGTNGPLFLSRKLTNNGTINYAAPGTNYLNLDGGSWLQNVTTFNITGDFPINSNSPATSLFDNRGGASLNKTGGGSVARIGAEVNNAGFVSIPNGQLAFNGGGSNSGSISFPASNNALMIEANTYVFAAGTSVNLAELGWFIVDGGTLNLTTPLTLERIELRAGGITGSNLIISEKLVWNGGALFGPGTTTIPNTSSIDALALTQPISLDNRSLDNNGTFKWNPGIHHFELVNAAGFFNNVGATFEIQGDRFIDSGGASTINNAGTIRKTGGVSGTVIHPALNNNGGTVSSEVNGQSLILAGGGSMAGGTLTTTGTALLDFFSGTFSMNGGGIAGTGTTRIVGGILQVNANVNALTTFALESGVLEVNSPSTFQITTFQWKGGTVQGNGTKRVFGGFIGNTAPTSLNAGVLTIPAPAFSYDADATNHLTILGSASLNIESGATMTITGNGIISGAAPAKVTMSGGTLAKSNNSTTARIDVPLDQTFGGAVTIADGILELRGGGIMPRPITLTAATSMLRFALGTFDLGPGASVGGIGAIAISGGIVNANTALSFPRLELIGGVLQGSGAVSLGGGTWSAGDMDGTGTTTVNTGTFDITTGMLKRLRRGFTNNATVRSVTVPTALTLENAVTLTNNGLFELQENTNFFCACLPTPSRFHNAPAGTLRQLGSAGTSNFLTRFDNDGIVDLQTGILHLLGSGVHAGDFTIGGPTALFAEGPSQNFSSTVAISGSGAVVFGSAAGVFAGTYSLAGTNALTAVQGVINFTAPAPIATAALDFRSGMIGGNSAINVTGGSSLASQWQSGTLTGTGAFTIGAPVTFTIDGVTGPPTLDGRTITNNGTIAFNSANPLTLTNSASIVNAGLFEIQNDAAINAGAGTNTFLNNSNFTKIGAGGTTSFAPIFTNTANVTLSNGTVLFAGGFTQTGGTTTLSGGNLNGPGGVNINGGTLRGNGTVTGNVNNSATVSPGLSPGLLTISGNYSQGPAGTLAIEIGGTAPGSGYDRLAVTGNATLNGTLSASFFGGFIPTDNDIFDVVTFGSRSGTFSNEILPTFPGGGTLTPTYEPAAYRLTANATQADLDVTQTTSGPALHGQNVTFTVTVKNNGPNPTGGVMLTDTLTGGTLVSATSTLGTCSGTAPIVCNIGTLTSGQSAVVTLVVNANTVGTISNTASVSGLESDPNTANNATGTANVVVSPAADLGVSITESGDPVIANGAMAYTVAFSQSGPDAATAPSVALAITNGAIVNATSASFTCSGAGASATCTFAGTAAPGTRTITVNVQAPAADGVMSLTATASSSTGDPNPANNSATANTAVTTIANLVITKTGPATAEVGDTITFTITVENNSASNAANVVVDDATPANLTFTGTSGDCATAFPCSLGTLSAGASATIQATYVVGSGAKGTTVVNTATVASTSDPDAGNNSASAATQIGGTLECIPLVPPLARVVGQATSAKTYDVEWDLVPGATRYEVDEAANPEFTGAITAVEHGLSHTYKHDVTEATAFYYRVRAFSDCDDSASAYSQTIRVVIIPLPPKEQGNPNVNVPAGSTELIVQQVFIPGEEGQTLFFTATTDRPWLSVTPPSGVLPPEGLTLHVIADPKTLPNGTFTATVIVTIEGGTASRVRTHGTTVSRPITVNLVTPVTPKPSKEAASQHAIIVPAVGHLDGLDSHWQSDVRVTNAGFRNYKYKLTFTPAGGTALGVKETNITVDAGATVALDDIVKNWFGQGSLNDGASGMLEILPLDDAENAAKVTVASSRTYNVTANGTLGQFIPAVPFPQFIGRAAANALPTILGLQQIAQAKSYRTNVGIVEASGQPVQALINVFNAAGTKLLSIPTQLLAGQQLQMNGLLAANNLTLDDGRIEVQVTGGDGKITAYASVIDGDTGDPLLVSGTPLTGSGATKYVLPGVANLNSAFANWRTDMRVFNYGTAPQSATLTFYPVGNPARVAQVVVNPGQVLTLDNIVKTLFDGENLGGVVHLTTPQPASFVVTGRTYNQTDHGTFGQFIPAVTVNEAVAKGGRTLHILQVEDSVRYRTNIGLSEVSGQPALVELQVVLPDSKITPTVQVPLAANEFRQFSLIRDLGLGNVYNARIAVRVLDGTGRVTAYGSVIDEDTNDPTYVPAQ